MTEASLVRQMTAARSEHLAAGREIHMQGMRGRRYCEVSLISGTSQDSAIANIWNTTGACDPAPEQLDALDAEAIARENGAARAWLDPVRRWMADRIDVRETGHERAFGTITGTWMAAAGAAAMMRAAGSYDPVYIYRSSTFTFDEGSEVYLLDAPDGEVFVMLSVAQQQDLAASEDGLAHLGGRLDLPPGWGFRAELLDRDLEVSSNPDNLAHVAQDDLRNVYQGSDAGRAFSHLCREYERW